MYQGIIPAFYACYDKEGAISPVAVREMTRWLIDQGVRAAEIAGGLQVRIKHLTLKVFQADLSGIFSYFCSYRKVGRYR